MMLSLDRLTGGDQMGGVINRKDPKLVSLKFFVGETEKKTEIHSFIVSVECY